MATEDAPRPWKAAHISIDRYSNSSAFNHAAMFFFALEKYGVDGKYGVDLVWTDGNFVRQWDSMEPRLTISLKEGPNKHILLQFNSMGYLIGLERDGEIVYSESVSIWPVTKKPKGAEVYDPFSAAVVWLFDDNAEDDLNIPDSIKLHFN